MKKVLFLVALLTSATIVYPNVNLRPDNGETHIALSGSYTHSFSTNNPHAFGGNITVAQMYPWFHFGAQAGMSSNGCFNSNVFVGPKFGNNFYVAPSATIGLRQVRETNVYENTLNGDIFRYKRPAPRFAVGANLRLGYNFGSIAVFGSVGYERTFSYSRGEMLHKPWVCVEQTSPQDILTAEIGVACVLSEDNFYSGDNCLEFGVGGGYSTMGAYASVELKSFDRIGYVLGHNYGGFINFYVETGNAEIGAQYSLDIYPFGSDSWYYTSVGVEAAMGMYQRSWSGTAIEKPERFSTLWSVYSFGGRGGFRLVPIGLQFGPVKIALNLGVGIAAQLPSVGDGAFGYQTDMDNVQSFKNNLKITDNSQVSLHGSLTFAVKL